MAAPGYHVINIVLDDGPCDLDTILDGPLNTFGFVKLPRLYMDIPVCACARATLFTGQTCATHGVTDNQWALDHDNAGLPEMKELAPALRRADVHTALIGKYLNGYNWQDFDHNQAWQLYGWNVWRTFRTNNGSGGYLDYNLTNNGVVEEYGSTDADYSTDVLTDLAVDFITNEKIDRPWYVHLAPYAPHDVAIPPTRYATTPFTLTRSPNFNEADISDKPQFIQQDFATPLDQATIDGYDTEHIDALRSSLAVLDQIQAVINALDARGILDNTIVLVSADNYVLFGEHRLRAKPFVYEECAKGSGMWVLWPGVGARTDDRLLTNCDIAPTIAANFGVPLLQKPYGMNVAPLIEGDVAAGKWRTHVLSQRIGVGQPNRNYRSVTADLASGRWVYTTYYEVSGGDFELYDLTHDPYQLTNVAGQGRPEEAEMAARLTVALKHA